MIIFDLDGTLADCEHRRHFVDPEYCMDYLKGCCDNDKYCEVNTGQYFKPDWKAFYEACEDDKPILPVRDILWALNPYKNKIAIWSGRCESVRDKTIKWLIDHIFLGNFITMDQIELKMRPIGDNTPDDQLKERWYDLHNVEHPRDNIEFVFDDRPKVVRMYRRRGIFVFDCNQNGGDF